MKAFLPIKREELEEIISLHLGETPWGVTHDLRSHSFDKFQDWLAKGKHGTLSYLEGERGRKRESLQKYYSDTEQAIVFLFPYAKARGLMERLKKESQWNGHSMASYALGFEGMDYHKVIGDRLSLVLDDLKKRDPHLEGEVALDIHPVLDRDLAYRAGLGWFGKNSLLINRGEGSFTIIGAILLNKTFDGFAENTLEIDHCGHCTACIDICPTDAIDVQARTIKAAQCISTFTIELFKEAPPIRGHKESNTKEIFGCDLCQDICPWNKRPIEKATLDITQADWNSFLELKMVRFFLLRPLPTIIGEIASLSGRAYQKIFKGTSLERLGKKGMLKNLKLFLD